MLRILLVLTLFLNTPHLLAETSHADEQGTAKTGKRLAAEGKLSSEAIDFISTNFFRSKEIVRKDYEAKIPEAIEKAIQNKEEGDIAKITATLVSTVSSQQAEKVIENAKKEIKDETEGKDEGKYDTRYVALMERILWAAMNRNGEASDKDKAKAFNEAFAEPYNAAKEFAKTANEKSKQAAQGNKEAKKWVDENIRKDTVLGIAEGLRKTGDKKNSDYLIAGQAFDVGGGQKALDMWGPGKEPQRMYLGNSEKSNTQAIDSFLGAKKTFGENVTARNALPNDANLKSWYADASGKFQKGAPPGVTPTEPPTDTGGGGGSGGGTPSNTNISQLESAVTAGKCTNCHNLTIRGTSLLDAEIVHPDGAVKLADFPARFNNANDPMFGKIKGDVKAQFEQFAKIQRGAK